MYMYVHMYIYIYTCMYIYVVYIYMATHSGKESVVVVSTSLGILQNMLQSVAFCGGGGAEGGRGG